MIVLMNPWVMEILKRQSLSNIPTTPFFADLPKIVIMRGGEGSAKRSNPSSMLTLRYIGGNNLTILILDRRGAHDFIMRTPGIIKKF